MKLPVFLLAVFAALALQGCGGSDPEVQISGMWTETYECTQVCDGMSSPLDGTTGMTLSQDGASVTRTDDGGTTWTGELSGRTATFNTSSEGYEETSTFTFQGSDANPTSFTVESSFTSSMPSCTGTCTGTGTKQ